jgi:hypothetical protein
VFAHGRASVSRCFYLFFFKKRHSHLRDHVDAKAHIGCSNFATKAMMCCYLGRFSTWAQAAFLLLASCTVNHREPFFIAVIYSKGDGDLLFLLLTAIFALYYAPAFSRLIFRFQPKVASFAR